MCFRTRASYEQQQGSCSCRDIDPLKDTIRRRMLLLFAAGVITGCATTTQVTDFSDRSVGYGCLNVKDVQAIRLHDMSI
jgi:hypothetical protein